MQKFSPYSTVNGTNRPLIDLLAEPSIQEVLETQKTGSTVSVQCRGSSYRMTIVKTNILEKPCREFILRGTTVEEIKGVACRQSNGYWSTNQ